VHRLDSLRLPESDRTVRERPPIVWTDAFHHK
jgi:hypothetical protein